MKKSVKPNELFVEQLQQREAAARDELGLIASNLSLDATHLVKVLHLDKKLVDMSQSQLKTKMITMLRSMQGLHQVFVNSGASLVSFHLVHSMRKAMLCSDDQQLVRMKIYAPTDWKTESLDYPAHSQYFEAGSLVIITNAQMTEIHHALTDFDHRPSMFEGFTFGRSAALCSLVDVLARNYGQVAKIAGMGGRHVRESLYEFRLDSAGIRRVMVREDLDSDTLVVFFITAGDGNGLRAVKKQKQYKFMQIAELAVEISEYLLMIKRQTKPTRKSSPKA